MTNSAEEQDRAAGGAHLRQLRVQGGEVVTASIAVRSLPGSKQLYGYLQFKLNRKTTTRYVGKVSADTKAQSLILAWATLRERHLVELNGWAWVNTG